MKTLSSLSLVLALFFCSAAGAQNPGDLIVVDTLSATLRFAPRGASAAQTWANLPAGLTYGPMMNGSGDGSALVMGTFIGGINRNYLMRVDDAGVNTLSTFFMFPEMTADIGRDDAGDLLVLNWLNGPRNGLYRAPISGATTLTPVFPWPQNVTAEPLAFVEDLDSGDYWTMDVRGDVHRLSKAGAVLSIVATSPTTTLVSGDLAMDPLTGDLLITSQRTIFRYDPLLKKLTTVLWLGVPQGGSEAMGLRFDHQTRGYLFSNWMGFGPGMFGFVHELDATATTVRTTSFGSRLRPVSVISRWGGATTALGPPAIGTTYAVKIASRIDSGAFYQVALSFSRGPGIPTSAGTIPLTPDPLFFLSMSGAPLFARFAGRLDRSGTATPTIAIPNATALRGARTFLAAVAYDATGIRRILGPHGFTIR